MAKGIQEHEHVFVTHVPENKSGNLSSEPWSALRVLLVYNSHALDLSFDNTHRLPYFTDLYVHKGGELVPVVDINGTKLFYGKDEDPILDITLPSWLKQMIEKDTEHKFRVRARYADSDAADVSP